MKNYENYLTSHKIVGNVLFSNIFQLDDTFNIDFLRKMSKIAFLGIFILKKKSILCQKISKISDFF
jgi:hypothetical protein